MKKMERGWKENIGQISEILGKGHKLKKKIYILRMHY